MAKKTLSLKKHEKMYYNPTPQDKKNLAGKVVNPIQAKRKPVTYVKTNETDY